MKAVTLKRGKTFPIEKRGPDRTAGSKNRGVKQSRRQLEARYKIFLKGQTHELMDAS